MTRLVLDASVVGGIIIPDEHAEVIPVVVEALSSGKALVPQHWRLEVANQARMAVRKRRLSAELMRAVFADLRGLAIEVDQETDRLAWSGCLEISQQHDLTTYDAAYLELALREKLPLATRDKRLRSAAQKENVELIPS